ncbi:flagellar export protein FliJ [Massilia timonae]|uniref:Flagellar export protein FliJ n=1 Tax=Massilia timonae CCUG 45783 TaxID=883126 RepID=K9DR06_9BURK|nr:flagellar export protein FliJ [Massilia timonae]EKU81172.1 flagellar export protein FliJ [Massilia timonae CCUG 45783]
MKRENTIRSLDTLVQLRSTQVDRLQADLASQEATRVRYQVNLERLALLAEGSGASGATLALNPALALNCGAYKQGVLALADSHRTDLALHEANMAVAQGRLKDAWVRRELLGKVLVREQDALAVEQERATRKREDDIATQSWMAGKPGGLAAA